MSELSALSTIELKGNQNSTLVGKEFEPISGTGPKCLIGIPTYSSGGKTFHGLGIIYSEDDMNVVFSGSETLTTSAFPLTNTL
jgi:hypothetical protein